MSVLTLTVLAAFAAVSVTCGSDKPAPALIVAEAEAATSLAEAETAIPTKAPSTAVTVNPASSTAAPSAVALDPTYDSTLMMYAKYPGLDRGLELTEAALESILEQNDVSQVPVLVDLLMLLPLDARGDITELLHDLTGQDIPGNEWHEWVEWLGKHRDEYRPPAGYATWKRGLFTAVDRRFAMLLRTAGETARIDLSELAWGGVPPDGIPDLQDPPVLAADEAAYLSDEERVFGLSINGEHRAYPLRIVNPHEMVNDTLVGEPVALSW